MKPLFVSAAFALCACVSGDDGTTVTAPTPIGGPSDVTVTEPAQATFSAQFAGSGPIDVQWQRSVDGIVWIDDGPVDTLASAGTSTHETPPTAFADSGIRYHAIATNGGATATTGDAVLTVLPTTVAPTLAADLRDVAVPEGATAVFAPSATGASLTYAWEEETLGTFAVLPGETAATLTLPSVTPTMNNRRYRVSVTNSAGTTTSRIARLTVFSGDELPRMYVQYGPSNTLVQDPVFATAAPTATANLATGELASMSDSLGVLTNQYSYSGTFRAVIFVNNTGAVVTIPAGAIRATVDCTYTHVVTTAHGAGASARGILSARINSPDGIGYSAAALHNWSIVYNSDLTIGSSSFNRFMPHSLAGGGTATASVATFDATSFVLELPAIVLAPGDDLRLTFSVQTTSSYANADAATTPMKVTMTLPAGVSLDRNTTVPLSWVN